MAKNDKGNDIYSMILEIVFNLSPKQAEGLYAYLLPRYTTRARSKLYNADGEEDINGKIRLLPSQYQAIRTKYGDNYMHKAFKELNLEKGDVVQFEADGTDGGLSARP